MSLYCLHFNQTSLAMQTIKFFEWVFREIFEKLANSIVYNCIDSFKSLTAILTSLKVLSQQIAGMQNEGIENIVNSFLGSVANVQKILESEIIGVADDYVISILDEATDIPIHHMNLLSNLTNSKETIEFCYPVCQKAIDLIFSVHNICSVIFYLNFY